MKKKASPVVEANFEMSRESIVTLLDDLSDRIQKDRPEDLSFNQIEELFNFIVDSLSAISGDLLVVSDHNDRGSAFVKATRASKKKKTQSKFVRNRAFLAKNVDSILLKLSDLNPHEESPNDVGSELDALEKIVMEFKTTLLQKYNAPVA